MLLFNVIKELPLKQITEHETYIIALCPFHDERTPSFTIFNTNTYYCFGCLRHGSVVKLLKFFHQPVYSFLTLKNEIQQPVTLDESVLSYYDNCNTQAKKFLQLRYLNNNTIKNFGLLYHKNRGIVIPARDDYGNLVGLIFRTIEQNKKKYIYSKGFQKSKILFNLYNLGPQTPVTITEGSFDVMRLHSAGVYNTVATLGGAVNSHHIILLKKHNVSHIALAFDNDKAGELYYNTSAKLLEKQGFSVKRISPPAYRKDWGEATQEEIQQKFHLEASMEPSFDIAPPNPKRGKIDIAKLTQNFNKLAKIAPDDTQIKRGPVVWFRIKNIGEKNTIQFLEELDEGVVVPRHDRYPIPPVTCSEFYNEKCQSCIDGSKITDHYLWNIYNFTNKRNEILDSKEYAGSVLQQLIDFFEINNSITKTAFVVTRAAIKGVPYVLTAKDLSQSEKYDKIQSIIKQAKHNIFDIVHVVKPRKNKDASSGHSEITEMNVDEL